jgi:sulfite exporter TauE/SafE
MSPATLLVTGLGTGLVAGGASCAAIQGGLLATAVTRRAATSQAPPSSDDTPQAEGSPAELPRLAPVGVFLAGKLLSHTALGAALGAFGAVLQPSARLRAALLLAAAMLMVFFALELIGVRAVRRWAPRPPVPWMRLVRRSSRSTWTLTPAILGLATVLLPCGVTLSMELVAVTSGSLLAGAAVMAGFVLGTTPLFAVLGYLLRRSTQIWQGRLRIATGATVLIVAAWTAVSGLRLGGWLAPPVAGPAGSTASAAPSAATGPVAEAGRQIIRLEVGDSSYSPARITARAGIATTLLLHTDRTTGCTRSFAIPSLGIEQVLPETGQTAIDLGTSQAGTLRYTCSMGMYGGVIHFTGR